MNQFEDFLAKYMDCVKDVAQDFLTLQDFLVMAKFRYDNNLNDTDIVQFFKDLILNQTFRRFHDCSAKEVKNSQWANLNTGFLTLAPITSKLYEKTLSAKTKAESRNAKTKW